MCVWERSNFERFDIENEIEILNDEIGIQMDNKNMDVLRNLIQRLNIYQSAASELLSAQNKKRN